MSNKADTYIKYEELLEVVRKAFEKTGIKKEYAQMTSEAICSASLRGTDSHGIRLTPHYLNAIKAGRIDPTAVYEFEKTTPSTGILDARHGIAHAAVAEAMDHAIELAKESGSGFVSVKNSNHCGAMAYYGLRAAEKDMIGLAFTNATPKLQAFNSSQSFFGLNPICFTAPMEGEEPFCYDASPTVMSNNKIKMIIEEGGILPEYVAADKDGNMTTNPEESRMLIPLGGKDAGYKGYALSIVVDILCSLLSGMPNAKDISAMYEQDGAKPSEKRYLAQFVGAIRIDAFQDVKLFKRRLKETANAVRSLPVHNNAKATVMMPGDPEKEIANERFINGVPVDNGILSAVLNNSSYRSENNDGR